MLFLLALITLAATVAQTLSFRRMCAYVERELENEPLSYSPYVSVILPLKGLDSDFDANIGKLLDQDYKNNHGQPNFEVIFAVANVDDPAYVALDRILKDKSHKVKTSLVVATANSRRGHKVNNQLCALEHISPDSEVLVFVDADVIARNDFIRYLVAHLSDPQVGATTGYRFYIPFRGDWPSLLRSLWNRMSAWELASPRYSFAWGGAMAIRKEVFARAKVAEHWDKAADDDLSLTTAVKSLNLKVRFVPQCLVVSDGDATLPEIVEWTNRQLILTKVYYPRLWVRAIVRAVILATWLVLVVAALAQSLTSSDLSAWLTALVGLALLPIELWFLIRAQGLWLRVLSLNQSDGVTRGLEAPQTTGKTGQSRMVQAYRLSLWRFSLVVPLAHIVLPWMTLYSLLTNRIKWRGIVYELKSPTETVII